MYMYIYIYTEGVLQGRDDAHAALGANTTNTNTTNTTNTTTNY